MTDLLRIVMVRAADNQNPDPDRMEAQVRSVAEEMGVSDVDLGPRLDDTDARLISMT
jgi:hypothetical protein